MAATKQTQVETTWSFSKFLGQIASDIVEATNDVYEYTKEGITSSPGAFEDGWKEGGLITPTYPTPEPTKLTAEQQEIVDLKATIAAMSAKKTVEVNHQAK